MSDLDKFLELYKSLGIELTVYPYLDDKQMITMQTNVHPKFTGYSGCYSEIVFDLEGRFLNQEFWG